MPERQPIPEGTLEVIEPDRTRRSVPVAQSPFLIGRGAEAGNHLQLADMRISRNCAAVVYTDGEYHLEDRGHRHGIFVNGERIKAGPLRDSDTITFGLPDSYQLIFHCSQRRESLTQLLSQLEQAGALEEGARAFRHLSLLLEATTLLQSHLPLEEVLGTMVDRAITLTDADRGLLLEADPNGELRPLLARERDGRSIPAASLAPSKTVITHMLERRRSVVEQDVRQAADLRDARSIVGQQLQSVVAIPLLAHRQLRTSDVTFVAGPTELLGALYLDSRRPTAFTSLERQILDTIALEASSVLDKARLAEKEMERRRFEQELSTARHIQQALLPKSFPNLPHLQVTGVNRSCLAVGGDYFDLIELSTDRTAFVIADVCGKGLGAALVTAMLQGTFSAMSLGNEPASVCAHVNRYICSRSEVQRYATLFFGIIDTAGHLEFINAGHMPPLLVRGASVESAFAAKSIPVGLFPQTEFKTDMFTLDPGDTLVLFTDGINEAMNPRHEEFGVERLKKVVGACAGLQLKGIQSRILAAVEEFTRGAPQADDVTLLLLRYQGTQSLRDTETH
jgi:serine phosphatase RsbU (regulator of sigma subunit)